MFGHSFQPTERLNEACAGKFVSLSTLPSPSLSLFCSVDAVDTAAQYNVTVQLMSSPGQNVNRIQ